jgi:hypothetical protein
MATTHFSTATPNSSASIALAANPNRVSALFVNTGSVPIYLGPVGVTVETGIPILTGGSQTDSVSTSAWYAITAGAAGTLVVCEVY